MVHAPATLRRLGLRASPALDLLELFAFVLPARAGHADAARAVPGPRPRSAPTAAWRPRRRRCRTSPRPCCARLAQGATLPANRDAAGDRRPDGPGGLGLGRRRDLAALGQPDAVARAGGAAGLEAAAGVGGDRAAAAARLASRWRRPRRGARLAAILGPGAEQRTGQADYAGAAAAAFAPREQRGDPHLVLAEAGTGTGKTLGYVAPASLWAEKNRGTVWISTFTRHLQRQIDGELARAVSRPGASGGARVVRAQGAGELSLPAQPGGCGRRPLGGGFATGVGDPAGIVARWAAGDARRRHPGRRPAGLVRRAVRPGAHLLGLADRRGECIHAACPHWRRCFVEHTIRRARSAELVVANHALVMAQAAWGGLDDAAVPVRYVFDEGHHVFDAADGAFSAELSGIETAELRRWLLGAEGGRSRARGLRRRIEELVAGDARAGDAARRRAAGRARAARARAGRRGSRRMRPSSAASTPGGRIPTEAFLRLARRQVLARLPGDGGAGRARRAGMRPAPGRARAARGRRAAGAGAGADRRAAGHAARAAAARLDDEAEELDDATRNRIEAIGRSLAPPRARSAAGWQAMLRATRRPPPEPGHPARARRCSCGSTGARRGDRDVGLHRHWLDPTVPFAATLARPAHGLLVTSATLRDCRRRATPRAPGRRPRRGSARRICRRPRIRVAVASPFDYAAQTRAFVVTDVTPGDIAALAAAYRALFLASGGGALGLFTAIRRLQAVHAQIAPALEEAGIPLLAQHVDPMDNATLVDIFRTEEESCLLGTDAMRDGVDVPGRALRLVVFERVPWPRPDILHRERRVHLSGGDPKGYDDRMARLRLRQAFGRPDPPRHRSRRVRAAGPPDAEPAALGVSGRGGGAPGRAGGGGGGDAGVPARAVPLAEP